MPMRVAFINAVGGIMHVDESRVEHYKAAGYKLAANVVDSTAEVIDESEVKPTHRKKTRSKKEV